MKYTKQQIVDAIPLRLWSHLRDRGISEEFLANLDVDRVNQLHDKVEALNASFLWGRTPQGKDYWYDISISLGVHKLERYKLKEPDSKAPPLLPLI